MSDFDTIDYFTDPSLVPDPHPYFDHLRSRCPVVREPNYGVLAVTGYGRHSPQGRRHQNENYYSRDEEVTFSDTFAERGS